MEWAIENGGEAPDELVDLELCQAYGWTWQQVQDTPVYVRHMAWYHQQMKREAERQRQQRAEAPHA